MAGSFNKVILMGNLTRDPELRYTPQGTAVTDISLAVNDSRNKDAKATFVDVTLWDKAAEVVCEYMQKGRAILIEGRLQTDSWEDRETGKMRSKLKVVAQNFQFTDSRGGGGAPQGGGSQGGYQQGGGAPRQSQGGYSQSQGGNAPQQGYGGGSQNPPANGNFDPGGFTENTGGDDIPF